MHYVVFQLDGRPMITQDSAAENPLVKELEYALPFMSAPACHVPDQFRILVESLTDHAVVLIDALGHVATWSEGAKRTLGYKAEEILGQDYSRFFAAEDVASNKPKRELEEAALDGKLQMEGWRCRKDGSRFWAESSVSPFYQANGALEGFVTITKELTQHTRGDVLLGSVLDHAFNGIICIDEHGIIETFNCAAEKIFGFSQAEVMGRSVNILIPEPHKSNHDGYISRYLRTGEAKIIGIGREVVACRKDGTQIHIEIAITEFQTRASQLRHFVGIIRDISQRKQFEAHQARLIAVLEATPDLVGLAKADHSLLFLNRAGRKMVGLSENEDVTNERFEYYYPGRALERILNEGIPAVVSTGVWSGETTLLAKDGREIPVSQVILAHKDADGEMRFLSTIMRDLSDQKKLEEQLRQAQKMEAIGELAGGVAHDFNNLLTIVSGYSEILLSMLGDGDAKRESVLAIRDAGDRAAALTRQLLAFSRKTVLEPKVLDANAAVRDTEKMLRRLIGEDIRLTIILDAKTSWVKVDPAQLGQVLMNLAVNARDAMPSGGNLTIQTENLQLDQGYARVHPGVQPGQYVLIAMSDTGQGMTPEVKARIFEPFFTTKGVGKGTGLGLAVVHGIVKQSGGHIDVQSEAGRGTTFRIYLPTVKNGADAAVELDDASDLRGTEAVLLVEDEDTVRTLALLALQTHGFRVLAARDGEEALRKLDDHHGRLDLIATDVVMPNMDGRSLVERLKPRFPHIKVLYMSGYTDDAVVHHGILQEEVAFLQKPYTPLSLVRKVRQVLDQRQGKSQAMRPFRN